MATQTQIGIIGAGPAGLMLSHLLHLHGVESVILESRSREQVLGRVRAGLVDSDVGRLFKVTGVGDRMVKEGMLLDQVEFRFDGKQRFLNWRELVEGRQNTIYGQQEIVADLIERRIKDGGNILFDTKALEIQGLDEDRPQIVYSRQGETSTLRCTLVAACDGFHGIGRQTIPADKLKTFERIYPFAWLGIMAETPPASSWLVSAVHDRGYAMQSMRSERISRNYVQCDVNDSLQDWPDERVWEELHRRLETVDGWRLGEGRVVEKAKFELRSFVCEPMQYRKLFLAGDAAHVVPPTGGRGMNQAIADVCVLADAFRDFCKKGATQGLDQYSSICLERVWHTQQFTASQAGLLLRQPNADSFQWRLQMAQLDYLTRGGEATTSLAQCYAGARLRSSFLE